MIQKYRNVKKAEIRIQKCHECRNKNAECRNNISAFCILIFDFLKISAFCILISDFLKISAFCFLISDFLKISAFCILISAFCLNLSASEKPKIALVMSGGGAKGFAHIGMLKVIDELGIEVDYIIGTSMGAIIGGMYASGMSASEIEEIVIKLDWNSILIDRIPRDELFTGQKRWLPTANYNLALNDRYRPILPRGIINGNNIHLQLFYETWHVSHIDDFSEFRIPFKAIATDLETGELVLYDSGSIADIMRASSSIPSVFVPFELDDRILIDGGISQNLPADIARELGCDIVIGFRTNTDMFDKENLTSVISIMNQTLNIGMLYRQKLAEPYADIIIAPNTDDYTIMDFQHAQNIIKAGYNAALQYTESLIKLCSTPVAETSDSLDSFTTLPPPSSLRSGEGRESIYQGDNEVEKSYVIPLPDSIKFHSINVNKNSYLTPSAVRDYLQLSTDTFYNRDDIYDAFKYAYSTELFDNIYPNIRQDDDGYYLIVNVKERERRHIGINTIYNDHDSLIIGVVLSLRNVIQRNSNLLINLQFGGSEALEIDYTKTFNRELGMYFRLFPYIKEERLYVYNDDFQRVRSYRHSEAGMTAGIGSYRLKNTIIEPFIYSYRMEFTREIADEDLFDRVFFSTGSGVKLYYENVDDFPLYMKGNRFFLKYNISRSFDLSEENYQKLVASLQTAIPIDRNVSLMGGFEYGTYLASNPVPQDPFYIGGLNNFIGLNYKEISAPYYRKFDISYRINPFQNFYIDLVTNYVTYGNVDKWLLMDDSIFGAGAVVGYSTPFGPARVGFGVNQHSRAFGYISVGYDYDAFFFSRR